MALLPEKDELKDRVTRLLVEEIGPALQMDGGAIEVIDIVEGVARVRLYGSCSGCPSTVITILMGIEQELRRQIPEIEYLDAVP